MLAFSRADRPFHRIRKSYLTREISVAFPLTRLYAVFSWCEAFVPSSSITEIPTPSRDSNGGSMGKSYCQVKDIFDTLELSSYHSLLLDLFHLENRLDEIPSVNIISIRVNVTTIYIYISVLFHKIINNRRFSIIIISAN